MPEPLDIQGKAGFAGRSLTRHEREAGRRWDASYRDGPPPWDLGRPQPVVARLADTGAFAGTVLDAGCGTGDNAIHITGKGLRVLGFDVAETAVATARERAAAAGVDGEFIVADALDIGGLARTFDTVLDSALFHTLDRGERREYVAGLAALTEPGAQLYVLCFGDSDPENLGPHPVSREELADPFDADVRWRIDYVLPERLLATFAPEGFTAWLARVERT